MTAIRPPRVATWLLKNLGAGSANDQLLGDLTEEHANGRSSAWFWRQTFAAIVVSFIDESRAHKWIIARAILVGCTCWTALIHASRFGLTIIELLGWPWPSHPVTVYRDVSGTNVSVMTVMTVQMDMWTYLVGPLLSLFAAVLVACISGWLVGRLHWKHRIVGVVWFAAAVGVYQAYLFMAAPRLPLSGPFIETWFTPAPVRLAFMLLPAAAVLVGGIGLPAVGASIRPISISER